MKRLIAEFTPPIVYRAARRLWRRLHGLGSHDFYGAWPELSAVPVTKEQNGSDPWAETIGAEWRNTFRAPLSPTIDDNGKLILPLLISQFREPVTVLDFGGGPCVGLAWILRTLTNEARHLSYILVETPGMCRVVQAELAQHSAYAVSEIPTFIAHPLVVHAGGSLQYVEDYCGALKALTALAPETIAITNTPVTELKTYARQVLNAPYRRIASWVFNRSELVETMKSLGYELRFFVRHQLPLTHKSAPGPSDMATLIFNPARRSGAGSR